MSAPAEKLDTHGWRMPYGKHNGEPITRVPVGYLRWMINKRSHAWEYAEAELKRRGSVLPEIEITGHAIDTASTRLLKFWKDDRMGKDDGLHAWLHRVALAAMLTKAPDAHPERRNYKGIRFVFAFEESYPVLKTVMKQSGGKRPGGVIPRR